MRQADATISCSAEESALSHCLRGRLLYSTTVLSTVLSEQLFKPRVKLSELWLRECALCMLHEGISK